MTESPIRDVSDTAFWIAHHRAEESDRPDALFHDPLARRLAGERGQVIGRDLPAQRFVAWNVSVRTCIIDDFIREAIAQGVDMVLNLGAGLDARPWRMELPPTLRQRRPRARSHAPTRVSAARTPPRPRAPQRRRPPLSVRLSGLRIKSPPPPPTPGRTLAPPCTVQWRGRTRPI